MKQKQQKLPIGAIALLVAFIIFISISYIIDFEPGKKSALNFSQFAFQVVTIMPAAFILVSLFDVWVKRERVERHLGEDSGIKGYAWAIVLAGLTIGPFYVMLPVAYALRKKGASLGVVFAYLNASALCRIPMCAYEASFLGIKFTLVRLFVSLPIILVISVLFGKYLSAKNYELQEVE